MQRKEFLKLIGKSTAILLTSPFACTFQKPPEYPYEIHNDAALAHQIYLDKDNSFGKSRGLLKTKNLIIGGGLAGLSAAYQLKNQDFYLVELSDRLGGSSAAAQFGNFQFAQGAHYDLNYPSFFGEEILKMLEKLGIIKFNSLSQYWDFVEKSYLIDPHKESQSFIHQNRRENLLPDIPERLHFYETLAPYLGQMLLPSPRIAQFYHHLDQISFLEFLRQQFSLPPDLKRAIDYQMRDDYGGNSDEVSALAGVFYYTSRPNGSDGRPATIFSPPQGNAYFVEKILQELDPARIKTGHLVHKIHRNGNNFQVAIIELNQPQMIRLECQNIIYAAQKQGLPYIFPPDKHLFQDNQYIPWMSINIVLKKDPGFEAYWQNEFPGRKDAFIGFVDSKSQFNQAPGRVFTVYYCLKAQDRKKLLNLDREANQWIHHSLGMIAKYFDFDLDKLSPLVQKVFIKAMGHAMPLPYPGYLFKDKNPRRSFKNLVYAGVDNSRLPLLFEALDSGYQAVEELKKNEI